MKNTNIMEESELEEYENFIERHKKGHFAQSIRWAKTKDEWEYETVVVRDKGGEIKGSMLLLIRKMPMLGSSLVGVRIDIWTHFMRECIINYVH